MQRVLAQLTDDQLRVLRERSAASGRSVAALIRDAVDEWIAERDRERGIERALATVGQFHSGLGDLAEHHDRYVDDAQS